MGVQSAMWSILGVGSWIGRSKRLTKEREELREALRHKNKEVSQRYFRLCRQKAIITEQQKYLGKLGNSDYAKAIKQDLKVIEEEIEDILKH